MQLDVDGLQIGRLEVFIGASTDDVIVHFIVGNVFRTKSVEEKEVISLNLLKSVIQQFAHQ